MLNGTEATMDWIWGRTLLNGFSATILVQNPKNANFDYWDGFSALIW